MSLESSSLDADQIVDRRRLRRKLTFWRVAAVLIAIIAIIGTGSLAARRAGLFAGPGASIGVLFQYPNVSDLLKTIGVKVEEVKSSPLKAAPNGFEPTSPEARAAIESIVKDSYAWFRDLVGERRHLADAALDRVADGRV